MIINDTGKKATTPHEFVAEHRRLAKQARIAAATGPARMAEIRKRADEMRTLYPKKNIHEIYALVGHDMGILRH